MNLPHTPSNAQLAKSQAANIRPCYELIEKRAHLNAGAQALSGFFGIMAALAVDAAVIPTIYIPMWNDIRALYHQPPIHQDEATQILLSLVPELLSDLVFDKILGNVPVIGSYFNAVCAKQMTWRLGMLFALLAARGDAVQHVECSRAMALIRQLFPQKDMFTFSNPDFDRFKTLMNAVDSCTPEQFNQKIDKAMAAFQDS